MKKRMDYVTNSSSSSFIIINKTEERLTGKEIAERMSEKWEEFKNDRYYRAARNKTFDEFALAAEQKLHAMAPKEKRIIECGDHMSDDGLFECFIHYMVNDAETFDGLEVIFDESHH